MKAKLLSASLSFMVILALSGQGAAEPLRLAAAKAPAKLTQQKTGWQTDWQKTVEAAKREGAVVVYEQWGPQAKVELGRAFKDKFGIDIEFVSAGTSTQLVPKLTQERRAGLYLADVIGSAATTTLTQMKPAGILAPIEPMLVLPEVKDPKVWRGGKIFLDKEKLLAAFSIDFGSYVARNTELVKDGEIKSFYDLLDPKWKGKIVLHDPTITGPGNAWVFTLAALLGLDKTKEYLRQFIKQEPALVRDYRLQIEWIAKGKYALVAGVHAPTLMEFKKLGAPVAKLRVKEGGFATAGAGAVALPAGQLPHPNAAKVFINWLLTKEGQTVFSRGYLRPSNRIDVSIAGFEDSVPLPGDRVITEDEENLVLKAQMIDVAKEILAPLLK